MKLVLQAGIDPGVVVFEIAKAVSLEAGGVDGWLYARLGFTRFDPGLGFPAPTAFQESATGRLERSATFAVLSNTRFGFQVQDRDSALPLQIEMTLSHTGALSLDNPTSMIGICQGEIQIS